MKQQNKYEKLFDEFLDLTEFTLVKHQNDWSLIDNQDGNIGDIEGYRFESAMQIFDRMDIYIEDYIVESIVEELNSKGIDDAERVRAWCDWTDILEYKDCLPNSKWDFDVLDMICNHFEEINLENCTYEEE